MIKEYIPYYQRNLKVAGPVMLTQLGAAMAGIVDSIMVGHYGTTELAAVSFANSVFFTLMVFAFGALCGVTPLMGYAYVQNRTEDLREICRAGFTFCTLLSLVLMAVLLGLMLLFPHMGQDPSLVRACIPYYILATISTLPLLMSHLLKSVLEGLGNTMVAMVVAISLNLINIPLNWILIFGHCGFPALGATGAGIATLIVRVAQPLILVGVMLYRPQWRQYLQRSRARWSRVIEVMKIGVPIGLQQMMEIVAFTFSVTLVGWIDKESVAAHQVANHIADLFFMVSMGIGAAAVIRISHQYGEGRIHDMHMAAKAALHMGLLWALFAASVCLVGHEWIPRIFTEDTRVIAIAGPLFILCGLFQFSDAMQCIGGSMLRGLTDVKVPMWIAFVTYIVITLPLGYILMFPMQMGVPGMWIAFIVGLTIAAIAMLTRWRVIAPKEA